MNPRNLFPIVAGLALCLVLIQPCPAAEPAGKKLSIHALGRLEPDLGVFDISAAAGEQRIGSVLVREGRTVGKGELLVRLVGYEAQAANVAWLEAQVKTAGVRVAQERGMRQVLLEEAVVRQNRVRTEDEEAVKVQGHRILSLTAELAYEQREMDRAKALNTKEVLSAHTYDLQQLELAKAREALNEAHVTLESLKALARIHAKEAESEQNTIKAESLNRELALGLPNLEQELVYAREKLATYTIPSPVNGEILTVLSRAGEVPGQLPILKMADTSVMVAVAEVYETDLARVRTGMTATVTSPALPKPLTGKVVHISPLIFKRTIKDIDPFQPEDYRVAEVRIILDDPATASRFIQLQIDVALEGHP